MRRTGRDFQGHPGSVASRRHIARLTPAIVRVLAINRRYWRQLDEQVRSIAAPDGQRNG